MNENGHGVSIWLYKCRVWGGASAWLVSGSVLNSVLDERGCPKPEDGSWRTAYKGVLKMLVQTQQDKMFM